MLSDYSDTTARSVITTVCALCEAIRWAPCSQVCRVDAQSVTAEDRLRAGEQETAA